MSADHFNKQLEDLQLTTEKEHEFIMEVVFDYFASQVPPLYVSDNELHVLASDIHLRLGETKITGSTMPIIRRLAQNYLANINNNPNVPSSGIAKVASTIRNKCVQALQYILFDPKDNLSIGVKVGMACEKCGIKPHELTEKRKNILIKRVYQLNGKESVERLSFRTVLRYVKVALKEGT